MIAVIVAISVAVGFVAFAFGFSEIAISVIGTESAVRTIVGTDELVEARQIDGIALGESANTFIVIKTAGIAHTAGQSHICVGPLRVHALWSQGKEEEDDNRGAAVEWCGRRWLGIG